MIHADGHETGVSLLVFLPAAMIDRLRETLELAGVEVDLDEHQQFEEEGEGSSRRYVAMSQ
ncbi:hypothetical protein [Streptomyces sp. NRRL S-813]|uniref:hypothetical protein n=1 Tax=Streptomyces sp. NRRL S-813 TaxID=1463919 RepID=UPI0004C0042E|nr:hypothetical protein [Streptomyces sp. NRRL S-813]